MIEPTTSNGDLRLYRPARYPPAKTPTVATAQGGAVKSCDVNDENPNPDDIKRNYKCMLIVKS